MPTDVIGRNDNRSGEYDRSVMENSNKSNRTAFFSEKIKLAITDGGVCAVRRSAVRETAEIALDVAAQVGKTAAETFTAVCKASRSAVLAGKNAVNFTEKSVKNAEESVRNALSGKNLNTLSRVSRHAAASLDRAVNDASASVFEMASETIANSINEFNAIGHISGIGAACSAGATDEILGKTNAQIFGAISELNGLFAKNIFDEGAASFGKIAGNANETSAKATADVLGSVAGTAGQTAASVLGFVNETTGKTAAKTIGVTTAVSGRQTARTFGMLSELSGSLCGNTFGTGGLHAAEYAGKRNEKAGIATAEFLGAADELASGITAKTLGITSEAAGKTAAKSLGFADETLGHMTAGTFGTLSEFSGAFYENTLGVGGLRFGELAGVFDENAGVFTALTLGETDETAGGAIAETLGNVSETAGKTTAKTFGSVDETLGHATAGTVGAFNELSGALYENTLGIGGLYFGEFSGAFNEEAGSFTALTLGETDETAGGAIAETLGNVSETAGKTTAKAFGFVDEIFGRITASTAGILDEFSGALYENTLGIGGLRFGEFAGAFNEEAGSFTALTLGETAETAGGITAKTLGTADETLGKAAAKTFGAVDETLGAFTAKTVGAVNAAAGENAAAMMQSAKNAAVRLSTDSAIVISNAQAVSLNTICEASCNGSLGLVENGAETVAAVAQASAVNAKAYVKAAPLAAETAAAGVKETIKGMNAAAKGICTINGAAADSFLYTAHGIRCCLNMTKTAYDAVKEMVVTSEIYNELIRITKEIKKYFVVRGRCFSESALRIQACLEESKNWSCSYSRDYILDCTLGQEKGILRKEFSENRRNLVSRIRSKSIISDAPSAVEQAEVSFKAFCMTCGLVFENFQAEAKCAAQRILNKQLIPFASHLGAMFMTAPSKGAKEIVDFTAVTWQNLLQLIARAKGLILNKRNQFIADMQNKKAGLSDIGKNIAGSRGLKELVRAIAAGIRDTIKIFSGFFKTLFNYAAPALSITLLVSLVSNYISQDFGIAVELGGQEIGIISSDKDYDVAAANALERAGYTANLPEAPKYTLKILNDKGKYTDTDTLAELMLLQTSAGITEAYDVAVDGEVIGSVSDPKKIVDALAKYMLSFNDGDVSEIGFTKEIEYLPTAKSQQTLSDTKTVIEKLLGFEEKDNLYIAKSGDSLENITGYLGVTAEELADVNRNYDFSNIRAGDKIIYTQKNYFMPVIYTKNIENSIFTDYTTVTVEDPKLSKDKTKVVTQGQQGQITEVYTVTYANGVEIGKSLVSSVEEKAPVTEVIAVAPKPVEKPPVTAPDNQILSFPKSQQVPVSLKYIWPLHVVGRQYVSALMGDNRGHKGLDIASPAGTEIYAVQDGVVKMACYYGGYGECVVIEHADGFQTVYGHMSKIIATEGQKVSTGDVIGLVGQTGNSTGNHLHFEVRINGYPMNPLDYTERPSAINIGHY